MDWRDHITRDPGVLSGKPIIKGTRISVEHVLGLLESGWSTTDILESYPHPPPKGIRACLGTRARLQRKRNCILRLRCNRACVYLLTKTSRDPSGKSYGRQMLLGMFDHTLVEFLKVKRAYSWTPRTPIRSLKLGTIPRTEARPKPPLPSCHFSSRAP